MLTSKTMRHAKHNMLEIWNTSQYLLLGTTKLAPNSTLHYKPYKNYFPVLLCTTKLAQSTSQYYFVLQSLHKVVPSILQFAASKPDLDAKATNHNFEALFTRNFKAKITSATIEKICWQITVAALMQTLQYDLRDPAAKDNSITHAAAARSNLDAAITLRSAETELQNTIDLHATASEIAAPKPKQKKDDFEALCKRIFGRKIATAKIAKICWQITIAAWMQPPQYNLQSSAAKDNSITHAAATPSNLDAAIPMRSATGDSKTPYNYAHTSRPKAASSHHYTAARKKANRPQPQPPHRQGTFHRRLQPLYTEKTRFRASASSRKQSPCNIMQPLQCDLKAQIPKHSITMHAQAHPTQLEATVTMRQKKANQPQPQPPHRRGTFHRRLQPLYTEKHKVSCSGFLPKTEPLQHHAAIPMRSATGDSKTPCNYAHTSTPKAAWSHRYNAAKKGKPTAAATAAQTRYLSSPAAATLHGKKHKVSCSGFLPNSPLAFVTASLPHHFPSSPPHFVTASLPHHFPSSPHRIVYFPSSPLPFLTTSHRPHLPSAFIITSLRHHFPSPLPIVTTSLPHHFPSSPLPSSPLPIVTTSLPHHFPSSPLPFVTTSHRHHFPSSPLPIVTTSLRHHFPSSPLPFLTTSLRHHSPSSSLAFFTHPVS